ncbi:MAG: squalene/phytoene synthase family protein [Solirubrobacteraceae bacterium]
MSPTGPIEEAYGVCETITREQAANFYYGIRLLTAERRRAMCAVYAFARRVDDIGDGALPREEKLALLDRQGEALDRLGSNEPASGAEGADPVMVALADALTRFPLPIEALGELIEGVRMDIDGVSYESFDQLVLYCRRVAGTIGRVCLAIFGLTEEAAGEMARADLLADELGVALQLTNILRDIREDAENGRVYLAREDLRRFGLPALEGPDGAAALLAAIATPARGGGRPKPAGGLPALMSFEAGRAREWFSRGMALAPMLDRRSAACLLAMAGIYRRLLERIDADPEAALAGRMSLPVHEKALVAVRGMLGVGR